VDPDSEQGPLTEFIVCGRWTDDRERCCHLRGDTEIPSLTLGIDTIAVSASARTAAGR